MLNDDCIGVPHGVLGDIWVHLELKRCDKGDHWTSSAWERPYRSDTMNSLCPTSQSDLTRATSRGRSPFHHFGVTRSDLPERRHEVAPGKTSRERRAEVAALQLFGRTYD
ncbi:hypothetical protein F2Q70_00037957 [Brassica cretica]|uniref:Uncharacterized protein n=1 Tax=Brassica cretica TaxID=69181 RepID=A0A8S9K5N5_BRACR|nr:hypothetical protein F2Q70_00037957 [Brassica cretica]